MVDKKEKNEKNQDIDLDRRNLLKASIGGISGLGIFRSIDNIFLGYGALVGTNLIEQDLSSFAKTGFHIRPTKIYIKDYKLHIDKDYIRISDNIELIDKISVGATEKASNLDEYFGFDGVLEQISSDLSDINKGNYTFEFLGVEEFFNKIEETNSREYTAEIIRAWPGGNPKTVSEFTNADLKDTREISKKLIYEFRNRTYYDIPRYIAGSIQDNIIFGAVDLRSMFNRQVDFKSLNKDKSGMFCFEYVRRSIEALHSLPAYQQNPPVIGVFIGDNRHKHTYTGIASIIREDKIKIPMTFVDYTHTTLYDDLKLTPFLGDGFNAYDKGHRVSYMKWEK